MWSLQVKGLCNASTAASNDGPQVPVPQLPPQPLPPQPPDRLSEFANYLAANTQPQPLQVATASNILMPPGDLQPLDASGLINLEPPQQPVLMVNHGTKKRRSTAAKTGGEAAANKAKRRKSKKPFEELRRPNMTTLLDQPSQNGEQNTVQQAAMPDSSNIKHLGEVHDNELGDQVDGNGVGGITENWSDQQTIKVKVSSM